MKTIRKWLKAFRRMITEPWHMLRDYLRYRSAVQMADDAHARDSDRYYVLPSMDGRLVVMDRKNFRRLKRKGYISRDATIGSTVDECFYFTPNARHGMPISEEWRQRKYREYLRWCRAMRMLGTI